MKLSELQRRLQIIREHDGDVDVVLWDLDTGWYFALLPEHVERQQMPDGSRRVSIGPNSYQDEKAGEPTARPLT